MLKLYHRKNSCKVDLIMLLSNYTINVDELFQGTCFLLWRAFQG
jgi:hypothetical protein